MPATSKSQQRAAGADLARIRAGKKPRNFKGASEATIEHFARTKTKPLPAHAYSKAASRMLSRRKK